MNDNVLAVDLKDKEFFNELQVVPRVSMFLAIISFALNIIMPGFGTIVASCAVDDLVQKTQVAVGVLQFLTSVFIVGWIWAIWWGWLIFQKA